MHEVFEGTSPFDHIVGTLTNSAGLLRAIIVGSGTHNHSQTCLSSLSLTVPSRPPRPFVAESGIDDAIACDVLPLIVGCFRRLVEGSRPLRGHEREGMLYHFARLMTTILHQSTLQLAAALMLCRHACSHWVEWATLQVMMLCTSSQALASTQHWMRRGRRQDKAPTTRCVSVSAWH